MERTTLLLVFALLSGAAGAHQDRILSVRPDGVIPELPAAYGATRLHVAFSQGDHGGLHSLRFVSSGHETNLPPCLLRLVSDSSAHRLFVVGSWYHDESLLPHYISVKFHDAAAAPEVPERPRVEFLLSLRDARVLGVTRIAKLPGEASVRHEGISLVNGCPA
jgi:hypothetical protein